MFTGGGLAIWASISGFARRTVPGRIAFGWMQLSIALWAATAGLDLLVDSLNERVALSQAQYVGITSLPVLWLLFAGTYTRRLNSGRRGLLALWIIPVITVAAALTNGRHHLLWSRIIPAGPDHMMPLYVHGPIFWLDWVYANVLLATGTFWLAHAIRHYPQRYRPQTALLLLGVTAPWIGNLAYIFGLIPWPGLDATPLGFVVTGVCFAVGLFRYQLFELVPVARTLLFDSLGDAVYVLDPGWHVVDVNAAARRQAESQYIIGRPIASVLPWWPSLGFTDEPRPKAPRVVKIESGSRSLDVTLLPVLDERGWFAAWLAVVRDVTDRAQAESARIDLERRLLEQQHVESLSVLAGGLAHDFNNLLQAVLGNAEVAKRLTRNLPAVQESLDTVIEGTERAAEVVSKMRAYAGDRTDASIDIDLNAITEGMVDLLARSSTGRCTIAYEAPPERVPVKGDPTQLRQVALNLIVNATEAGGGELCTVTVRTGVERATRPNTSDAPAASSEGTPDRYAFLEVRDIGAGMDGATMARIFDPYFTTKADGRGLGLAAVQGIVRSHHGWLTVTSEPGKGSTFRVWLPLAV
jgi:signal transduction histidine kinase